MSLPLFIFRPEPGWSATAKAARGMGLDVAGQPLFVVEPIDWAAPDPAEFDGVLAGSANVFRHGGVGLAKLASLPVFAVGEATAVAARSAGFSVAESGDGAMQLLIDKLVGRSLRMLRLTGETRVPIEVPEGIVTSDLVIYRTVPQCLSVVFSRTLAQGGVVALHSGASAQHFRLECDRLGIDCRVLTLAVLAPRVATMAGEGWRAVHIAAAPSDVALLALAADLCQTG